MVNRLSRLGVAPFVPATRAGSYSSDEARELARSYAHNPAFVRCPSCGPECVEVLGFVRVPEVGGETHLRDAVPPVGEGYAVALYCHLCHRGAALCASYLHTLEPR